MVRDDVGGDADLERASLAFEQHEALRVSFDQDLKLDTQGQTLVRAGQLSATMASEIANARPASTPA